MAGLTIDYKSTQYAQYSAVGSDFVDAVEASGKVRVYYGYYKNTTGGTIATGKHIGLCKVPACRILPMSKVYFTAFGASATLDIGWDEYRKDAKGTVVAASANGIMSAINVASAGSVEFGTVAANQPGISITGQALLVAKTGGAVMPTNAEIFAYFLVSVE